jgi:hypothetical protein
VRLTCFLLGLQWVSPPRLEDRLAVKSTQDYSTGKNAFVLLFQRKPNLHPIRAPLAPTEWKAGTAMKQHACVLLLVVLALLWGCGGDGVANREVGGGQVNPPANPPSPLNVQGNWQFSMPTIEEFDMEKAIAGSITQSGSSLTGAVHLDGSECIDPATTISVAGSLSESTVSLTSSPVDGQVISLAGSVVDNAFNGTYAIEGGCADGEHGELTGFNVGQINGGWRIIFDVNEQHVGLGIATLTVGSASPEGSFGITGTVTNSFQDTSCFEGTISSGKFPNASYIMGTTVKLEFETADGGIVSFIGKLQDDGQITGRHEVTGGICDGYFGGACLGRDLFSSCHVPF